MSRSKKKQPIFRYYGTSDKLSKQLANRRFRRIEKSEMKSENEPPNHKREVSDVWDFSSDGKRFTENPNPKWMRK